MAVLPANGSTGLRRPAGLLPPRRGMGGVPRCGSRSRPRAGEAGGCRTHEQVRGAGADPKKWGAGRAEPKMGCLVLGPRATPRELALVCTRCCGALASRSSPQACERFTQRL